MALVLCAAVSIGVFYTSAITDAQAAGNEELRGVWVSTVANIDYPSKATTDAGTLKNELDTILDNCEDMGWSRNFILSM